MYDVVMCFISSQDIGQYIFLFVFLIGKNRPAIGTANQYLPFCFMNIARGYNVRGLYYVQSDHVISKSWQVIFLENS
jgi:hypothetical protein